MTQRPLGCMGTPLTVSFLYHLIVGIFYIFFFYMVFMFYIQE